MRVAGIFEGLIKDAASILTSSIHSLSLEQFLFFETTLSYLSSVYQLALQTMPGLVKEQLEITGARKALSIGIQYHNTEQYSGGDPPPMLHSSHHDPDVLKEMLMRKWFFTYVSVDFGS